jgi:hypothetical protein
MATPFNFLRFGTGLLGFAVFARKLSSMAGGSTYATHSIAALGGAVGVGLLHEAGYDPTEHLRQAGRYMIAGGEQALKQLPVPEQKQEETQPKAIV